MSFLRSIAARAGKVPRASIQDDIARASHNASIHDDIARAAHRSGSVQDDIARGAHRSGIQDDIARASHGTEDDIARAAHNADDDIARTRKKPASTFAKELADEEAALMKKSPAHRTALRAVKKMPVTKILIGLGVLSLSGLLPFIIKSKGNVLKGLGNYLDDAFPGVKRAMYFFLLLCLFIFIYRIWQLTKPAPSYNNNGGMMIMPREPFYGGVTQ
jgi:hypothetical protein